MHVIQLPSTNVQIEYLDSHADILNPSDKEKVVIAVHGNSWGAGVFRKALASAPEHGIRLIAMNRRGFGISSAYRQEELDLLKAPTTQTEVHKAEATMNHTIFVEERALELAQFLSCLRARLVFEKVILLGWSLGNFFCLKMLELIQNGSLQELGEEVKGPLKGFIMYEPPYWALPFSAPSFSFATYRNKLTSNVPPNLQGRTLNEWLGSYFHYPSELMSKSLDENQEELFEIGMGNLLGNMTHIENTIYRMDAEDMYGPLEVDLEGHDKYGNLDRPCGYTPHAAANEAAVLRGITLGVFADTASSVFFEGRHHHFKVPIGAIFCDNSAWLCVYARWKFKERITQLRAENPELVRDVKIISVSDANHFLHWDDPAKFMDCINAMFDHFEDANI